MNIFNKTKNFEEDINVKKFSSDLINDRFEWYRANLDKIVSNNLRDKFTDSATKRIEEERTYAKNFAEVSLFVDKITKQSGDKINNKQKEFMTESIFSAYEYLNKNFPDLYSDFKDYLDSVNDKVKNVSFEKVSFFNFINHESTLGKYAVQKIHLKDTISKLDENFDYQFLNLFTHEFCHALSTGTQSTGISKNLWDRIKNLEFLPNKDISKSKQNVQLNELLTEKMAQNILNENFRDIVTFNKFPINFTNDLRDKKAEASNATLEVSKMNYAEGSVLADVLDTLFKDDIERTYFDDNLTLKNFFEKNNDFKKIIEDSKDICFNYFMTAKEFGYADRKFSLPLLNDLNQSLINLIKKYDEINPLSSEDYFKVTDVFFQNKIMDKRYGFPANNKVIATLDIYKFGKDLKPLDENEVIDILSGRADEFKYKDYYKVLEKANAQREDYVNNIRDNINTKDREIVEITYPKYEEEFGENISAKLKKEDIEISL